MKRGLNFVFGDSICVATRIRKPQLGRVGRPDEELFSLAWAWESF